MYKIYFVYIVQCKDESYYTGITNDIDRRIYEHNHSENKKSYTYSRRPVELVYSEQFHQPTQAIEWEKQIKGWNRQKKDALIRGDYETIIELSNFKNNQKKDNLF